MLLYAAVAASGTSHICRTLHSPIFTGGEISDKDYQFSCLILATVRVDNLDTDYQLSFEVGHAKTILLQNFDNLSETKISPTYMK